jgi:SIT family siderophore-iron:H+ symporter-like MFS transporter
MTPVLAIPIILVLYKGTRPSRIMRAELRAARGGGKRPSRSEAMTVFLKGPSRARWTDIWAKREGRKSIRAEALSLFWQLDTIGLLLCVLGFGLFFVTITIANGPTSEWSDREFTVSSICALAYP